MLKYIVYSDKSFALFTGDFMHSDFGSENAVAAGFYMDGYCFGESVTLNLKSRREVDAEIIKRGLEG